jgi:hypothetical protein
VAGFNKRPGRVEGQLKDPAPPANRLPVLLSFITRVCEASGTIDITGDSIDIGSSAGNGVVSNFANWKASSWKLIWPAQQPP